MKWVNMDRVGYVVDVTFSSSSNHLIKLFFIFIRKQILK